MKNLLKTTQLLAIVLFLLLLLPSCNNEEIFVIESSALVEEIPDEKIEEEEEEEEEESNSEDEAPQIDTVDDSFSTIENVAVDIEVYLNDENLPDAITIFNTNPSNGILTINSNQTPNNSSDDTLVYTPNPSFSGTDSFEYTICDATDSENCDTAVVTIIVEPRENDFATELKAFPLAFGAGANVSGGRGGQVIHVTNLNDNGVGSLRDALNKTFPRTIVFDVSGEIDLQSRILMEDYVGNYGNVTIAGQTAPNGGITITGNRIWWIGCNNIIIRNIIFRNGIGSDNGDCLTLDGSSDAIIDSCSFAWAKDEALDIGGSGGNNVTVQNCLFYENKTGLLLGGTPSSTGDYSVLRNVYVNTSHRFPKTNGAIDLDVINNLIYNWRYRTLRLDASVSSENFKLNLIGNYFESGNNTLASAGNNGAGIFKIATGDGTSNPKIYSRYNHLGVDILNYYNLTTYDENSDESAAWSNFPSNATQSVKDSWFVNTPFALKGVAPTILTNTSLKTELLPEMGAYRYLNADGSISLFRDSVDTEAIAIAKGDNSSSRSGSDLNIWDSNKRLAVFNSRPLAPSNSRPAGYDTDNDGMADIWERATFGNLTKTGRDDTDNDGYTDLEEFLNLVDNI